MKTTRTFDKFVDALHEGKRITANEGGTRSGKTYSILQLLSILCPRTSKPKVFSVVSETIPHLKRGAIRDFKQIMIADNRWDELQWNKTDSIYTFPNGSILEFFSADNPAKVHGSARDWLFINECQNISWEIARQLFVRTRERIILDFNPTHQFWVHTKIQPREDSIFTHSTYKDNDFLTPTQVAEIESNKTDRNWWRVYGEGKVGMLEGLIYPDFEQIDEMPIMGNLKEVFGMDYGFQSDPTACVRVLADTGQKIAYADELCYRTRMLNSDIVQMLKDNDVPLRSVPIYADCAEPKSIAEIANAGFNILPCDKSAPVRSERLKFQILWMQGWKFKVTKRSTNLIKELRNYTWAKDKDGNNLNYPIDTYNHILDGFRYALFSHFGRRAGAGKYTISFNR